MLQITKLIQQSAWLFASASELVCSSSALNELKMQITTVLQLTWFTQHSAQVPTRATRAGIPVFHRGKIHLSMHYTIRFIAILVSWATPMGPIQGKQSLERWKVQHGTVKLFIRAFIWMCSSLTYTRMETNKVTNSKFKSPFIH